MITQSDIQSTLNDAINKMEKTMNRKNMIAVTAIAVLLSGCMTQSSKPEQESSATTPSSNQAAAEKSAPASTTQKVSSSSIRVKQSTPYAQNGMNDTAVMRECEIDRQLPEFIRDYAGNHGIEIALSPNVEQAAPGKNLVISFEVTRSGGNAFIGHYKYTQIKAVLYENGKQLADLTAARRSGGGAFAGFKGSCSVMGRTVKALGSDVAYWLQNPQPGARLGDL